jgi:hypothetical protein
MKLEIGKKYTPHSKSTGFNGLKNSNCWRRAKEKGDNFLYYTGVMSGHHCFNNNKHGVGGDYFLESDVTEYVETESMNQSTTKLQVGKKYVPHSKMAVFKGLDNSNCWKRAVEKKQNYLYYTGVYGGKHCFSDDYLDEREPDGDYFLKSDVTEYIENTKTESMKETFTVDKEFILEAHRAACLEWEKKIEKKFPELFAKTPIEVAIKKVGSEVFGKPVTHEGNLVKIPLPTANRAWSIDVFRYVQQFLSMYPNSCPVHRKEHDTSNFMYIEFSE